MQLIIYQIHGFLLDEYDFSEYLSDVSCKSAGSPV